ncbi:ceramide synthase 2-like isoform X2 [Carassius auratus]|uniref:Ceramide synthase 2-like isoform X2 n=1 Tax=Carassius auratus TaxID=7957 RepID=A0A6P6LJ55_CARAU|nr:ceramide synthase 2-like isoform X2 [Carassius auratus]
MLEWVSEVFWQERLWFPEGLGWADLEDRDGQVYAKARDLWVALPIAVLFLVIRQVFERYVATPLASLLGLKETVRRRVTHNLMLESYYCNTTKNPTPVRMLQPTLSQEHTSSLSAVCVCALQGSVEKLSEQTGWTERQVQRWFRRRRNQDRPNLLKKFCEASWRFAFYLLAFIGGLVALIDKPWLYDLKEMWKGFPTLTLLPSQYWYYMLELGFYTSLLFSLASDVKRKDFREQVIHHVATILLISFSWCVNYIRAGTLIMFMHDSADYLLESAKMFNYARWKNACNYIFILFAAIFIVTRLIIFPFRIMYCTWVYPVTLYPPFFGYYFFNGLLMVLLCLHVFWAALIIRLAFRFLSNNSSVEDERSDREETDESEEEEQMKNGEIKKNGPAQNGHATHNNNHSKKTE